MNAPPRLQAYSPAPLSSAQTNTSRGQANRPRNDDLPRKPDWLLIMIAVLVLLTLLIVWLVDVP